MIKQEILKELQKSNDLIIKYNKLNGYSITDLGLHIEFAEWARDMDNVKTKGQWEGAQEDFLNWFVEMNFHNELVRNENNFSKLFSILNEYGDGITAKELWVKLGMSDIKGRNLIASARKKGKRVVSINNLYKFGTVEETRKQIEKHRNRIRRENETLEGLEGSLCG